MPNTEGPHCPGTAGHVILETGLDTIGLSWPPGYTAGSYLAGCQPALPIPFC